MIALKMQKRVVGYHNHHCFRFSQKRTFLKKTVLLQMLEEPKQKDEPHLDSQSSAPWWAPTNYWVQVARAQVLAHPRRPHPGTEGSWLVVVLAAVAGDQAAAALCALPGQGRRARGHLCLECKRHLMSLLWWVRDVSLSFMVSIM